YLCISICMCYIYFFFFSSRRRHTRSKRDWSSDVCSSDLVYKTLKTKNTNIKTFLLVTLVTLLLSDMTSELSTHIKLGSFFYIILGFGIVYRDHENIHR